MITEARKLHLIEKVLHIESERTFVELENLINRASKNTEVKKDSFNEFAGIWSCEEANEISSAIHDACEKINSEDWK